MLQIRMHLLVKVYRIVFVVGTANQEKSLSNIQNEMYMDASPFCCTLLYYHYMLHNYYSRKSYKIYKNHSFFYILLHLL